MEVDEEMLVLDPVNRAKKRSEKLCKGFEKLMLGTDNVKQLNSDQPLSARNQAKKTLRAMPE